MIAFLKKLLRYLKLEIRLRSNYKELEIKQELSVEDKIILKQLWDVGYCLIPNYKNEAWCKECRHQMDDFISEKPQFVYKREDIRLFDAQHAIAPLKEFAEDQFLMKLASAYYGQDSTLGLCMANRIEFDSEKTLGSGGDWHRDQLFRDFKAILYLNDVSTRDGCFQIISKSHTANRRLYLDDMEALGLRRYETRFNETQVAKLIDLNDERLQSFSAKAGTLILVDTSAIHRGKPLQLGGLRYAVTNYIMPKSKVHHFRGRNQKLPFIPAKHQLSYD